RCHLSDSEDRAERRDQGVDAGRLRIRSRRYRALDPRGPALGLRFSARLRGAVHADLARRSAARLPLRSQPRTAVPRRPLSAARRPGGRRRAHRELGVPRRVKKVTAGLLAALALGFHAGDARAGDPQLEWYTLSTPHFRVNFHGGLEPMAQRAAASAENVYRTLGKQLDQRPSEVVEILLTDDTDFANGSAGAVPYNAVRLFATAPDDMSVLADYDDWLNELI